MATGAQGMDENRDTERVSDGRGFVTIDWLRMVYFRSLPDLDYIRWTVSP